jgi:hypothetical protein
MNNEKFAKEIEETCYGAQITKLIWVAASLSYNNDLKELYENEWQQMQKDIDHILPEITPDDYDGFIEHLIDSNHLGLIAELHIPVPDKFHVKEGEDKPWAWSSGYGHCALHYIYADTMEELVQQMKNKSEQHFNSRYKSWLKKQAVK